MQFGAGLDLQGAGRELGTGSRLAWGCRGVVGPQEWLPVPWGREQDKCPLPPPYLYLPQRPQERWGDKGQGTEAGISIMQGPDT